MRGLMVMVVTLAVAGMACSNTPPTAPDTVVLTADLTEHVPEKLQPQLKDAKSLKEHTGIATVSLDDKPPGQSTVTWHTLEDSFITDLEVKLKDNEACVVTSSGVGSPINLGSFEKPMMSVSFRLTCTHSNGRQQRTSAFRVSADGTLVKDG